MDDQFAFPVTLGPRTNVPGPQFSRRPTRRYNLSPVPLQFPSSGHFHERFVILKKRASEVEGLKPKTLAWLQNSFASFDRFLREDEKRTMSFISGNSAQQQRIAEDWIAWLRTRGCAHTTVATYWHGLDAIFRRFELEDGSFNPLSMLARPKAAPPLPRCLTRAAAEELMHVVRNYPWKSSFERHRNLAVVGLMLMAGLRRGEVLRLAFADVNVDERTIHIIRGKGKNGGKDRTAYGTPQLQHILRDYVVAREKAGRTHAAFLVSTRGNRPISDVTIRRLFARISAEMKARVSPHMLRHTYATLLRQSGVSDRIAQELLGHSSLSMLQRYSHVYEGECTIEASRLVIEF